MFAADSFGFDDESAGTGDVQGRNIALGNLALMQDRGLDVRELSPRPVGAAG